MTKIFKDYSEFFDRENYEDNGVTLEFSQNNENWKDDNLTNIACFCCRDCSDCSDCSGCRDCSDCSDLLNNNEKFEIPIIENIHQKVLAAILNGSLNMSTWHTCDTTHCRGGWIVFLAGAAGLNLEYKTSTEFAAMQIYKKSSTIRVSPVRFYESNEVAMKDIERCANEEIALLAATN